MTSPRIHAVWLGCFLVLFGVCQSFLAPFSNHRRRPQNVRHQPDVVLTVHAADKISAFSVVEDDDDDWYAGKSEEDYPDENEKEIYVPPEFSVMDDVDGDGNDKDTTTSRTSKSYKPPTGSVARVAGGGKTFKGSSYDVDDYQDESSVGATRRPRSVIRQKKKAPVSMAGTSWMEKNAKFTNDEAETAGGARDNEWKSPQQQFGDDRFKRSISDPKTFRQDFRKTRVFVKNIPQGISWQDLKDHFRVAGNVVFASISVDNDTGESKGHGIVQFETTAMAEHAIAIMRNHPLEGNELFVREDFQETKDPSARLRNSSAPKGPTPPTKWKCANEDNARYMDEEELTSIRNLIKARDDARRRRKYDVSDTIRDELKQVHGVFIDDRLKMWWTSVDGNKVPQSIHDIKGEGRWKLQPWRHIPTTPENDACVDLDLVEGLLKQRDISRREKDFETADALLEEARTSPDGDLTLRIHDESRTWRVWTEEVPVFERSQDKERRSMPSDPEEARKLAARECLEIVQEHAPEKVDETITILKRFHGREFQILKRLKQQYL